VNTVSAHKDGSAPTAIKEDPDKASSSAMAMPPMPVGDAGLAAKPGGSLLKMENTGYLGNPNEIKIKREVPLKIGKPLFLSCALPLTSVSHNFYQTSTSKKT